MAVTKDEAVPATPDQAATEKIGRAIEGQIFRLQAERADLVNAVARIAEIDAELAIFRNEQSKIAPRRPPKAVDAGASTKVNSADVNSTR